MPFFGVPIRNGLPIGLGSVAGFGVQQFDPSELFVGGTVAGAWYDPSDLSTMFDTSAGTTPVAMPGQGSAVSVGLMLDKSQGATPGPELVTPADNRDFSSDTGYWTKTAAGVSIGSGVCSWASSGGGIDRPSLCTSGKWYVIQYTITSFVSGSSIRFFAKGNQTTLRSSPGTYTEYLLCGSSATEVGWFSTGFTTCAIDNVSVRELPGNHAIAFNNTTARPELRARVNLLTYSEEFDNGAWVKTGTTVTANIATAPNGTTTADSFSHTTTSGFPNINQAFAFGAITYACSIYFKYVSNQWVRVDQGSFTIWFDVLNGVVGATGGSLGTLVSSSAVPAGNGWYKCTFIVAKSAQNSVVQIQNVDADNSSNRVSGTSTLIWAADLRPANIGANVPAYQRIADANTYDTSGFPLYLRFDGIDDSMYTPANLNLSGTDKVSVFAGVRKLSDAALGALTELSAGTTSNGVFSAFAPIIAGAGSYRFLSRGGASTGDARVSSGYNAPISNVFTGTGDIAGDVQILRLNGTQVAIDNSDQGAGNFGTYPLYIGSRANSSLFLNGQVYGLLVVGSAVSAGNISATEQWVAGKTGIAL